MQILEMGAINNNIRKNIQWYAKVLDPHFLSTNKSSELFIAVSFFHEGFTMYAPIYGNVKIFIKIAKSRVGILQ